MEQKGRIRKEKKCMMKQERKVINKEKKCMMKQDVRAIEKDRNRGWNRKTD